MDVGAEGLFSQHLQPFATLMPCTEHITLGRQHQGYCLRLLAWSADMRQHSGSAEGRLTCEASCMAMAAASCDSLSPVLPVTKLAAAACCSSRRHRR